MHCCIMGRGGSTAVREGGGPTSGRSLAQLQRLTDAALAHLEIDELLTELLDRITDILETGTAAMRLLDERAGTRIAAVQRVTEATLSALSLDELLDELLVRIRDILHTDTAAILLIEGDGTIMRARAAKGIEEEVRQGVRIPVGRGFAGRVAAERRPVFVPDIDA